MTSRNRLPVPAIAVLLAAASLVACATTRQTGRAVPSGFLEDYTILELGSGDQAQLRYVNPAADFSRYRNVWIESVTVWRTQSTAEISAEDQKQLTDHLYAALHEELGKGFTIVDQPGPDTVRLRAAITEAKGARVVGNTITTVVPQLRLLATGAGVATNTQVFVGKAAIEVELRDALTGQLLAAAVDERAGGKTLRGVGGTWKDVHAAFAAWAEKMRIFLETQRPS